MLPPSSTPSSSMLLNNFLYNITDFRCIFHLSDVERSDQQLLIRDLKPKVLSCEALASTVSDVELTSTSPTSIENLDIDVRVSDCAFLQVGQTCIQIRRVVYVNLNVTHLTARITRKNLSHEQINITISLIGITITLSP